MESGDEKKQQRCGNHHKQHVNRILAQKPPDHPETVALVAARLKGL
jgi:hypothetical protein